MLRVVFYLIPVFLIALGFAWLADRPGDMVVTFNGYQYQVTLMVAAVIVAVLIAAVMISWWLVKAIWNSPYTVSRYFRVRRRDRGYQALSTGMIAAGAGDAALARKKNREALKLISSDREPLIHLLDAQTSLLEGDHDSAREKFKAMLDDPEMRLLGLRGLYLEAQRLGERQAARHYASQAADIAPQLGWASESVLEERMAGGDWDGALRLVDAQRGNRQIQRDHVNRRRAVLLTAKAMSLVEADPLTARNAGQEAVRLAPDFVPAAVVAARAYIRQNDLRKAAKLLETTWRKSPHPDVANLYVHARSGDSVQDRLARAKKLQSLKQNNPESNYAVARAALEAGEMKLARSSAEAVIRQEPRERAFLLMADIEEAETGEQGRVREWLSRALHAPRDAAWVADGYVSDRWAPFSPVTGRIDAFEWKVPLERAAQMIEQERDGVTSVREALPKPVDIVPDRPVDNIVEVDIAPEAQAESKPQPQTAEPAPAKAAPVNAPDDKIEKRAEPAERPAPRATPRPKPTGGKAAAEAVVFVGPPDDPGVDPEDIPGANGRPRLF
jgi:HemY protein